MNAAQLRARLARRLARARLHYGHGARTARDEAGWLVASVRKPEVAEALAQRRIRERIPLAYLLNEAWLAGRRFYVDERAIVPRSLVAELLPEGLRPWLQRVPKRALDLCTGSGCLAVLLAHSFKGLKIDAADISPEALEVARVNVRRHRLRRRVRLVRSDLFRALGRRRYDLIVCNPPYVTTRAMRRLPREYRHEPALALAGGRLGIDFVAKVIRGAARHLAPGGLLVCEIGGNRRALERALPRLAFVWPEISDPGSVFILEHAALSRAARTVAAPRTPPRRGRAQRSARARAPRVARARPIRSALS